MVPELSASDPGCVHPAVPSPLPAPQLPDGPAAGARPALERAQVLVGGQVWQELTALRPRGGRALHPQVTTFCVGAGGSLGVRNQAAIGAGQHMRPRGAAPAALSNACARPHPPLPAPPAAQHAGTGRSGGRKPAAGGVRGDHALRRGQLWLRAHWMRSVLQRWQRALLQAGPCAPMPPVPPPSPPAVPQDGLQLGAALRQQLPWVKLVVSMREPISRRVSNLVHRYEKDVSGRLRGLPACALRTDAALCCTQHCHV